MSIFYLAVLLCCWLGDTLLPPNNQGSDTGVIPKQPTGFFWVKHIKKPNKKPAPNIIQFHFVMPVMIRDFFMFTASNDQSAMNLQIFR